jgi:hypothetical protein
MRPTEPPHREPAHCPAEATRWVNQWHVYRAIVNADWMGHRRIFDAIRSCVLMRSPGPLAILDLGCGDAGFIKPTFDEKGPCSYTSIDASEVALASTIEHVTHRDFPETAERACEMGREAGFNLASRELFRDSRGFHQLMAFTRGATS